MGKEKRYKRISEASELSGFSQARLRYLDKLGLVPSEHRHRERVYGEESLAALRKIKELLGRGYLPRQLGAMNLVTVYGSPRMEGDPLLDALKRAQRNGMSHLQIGSSRQSYNTAYKRLNRLAKRMGFRCKIAKSVRGLEIQAEYWSRA